MTGFPFGIDVLPDADTYVMDAHTLHGGTPARVLKLSGAGRVAWEELMSGPVRSPAGAALARKLTDAGLLHPDPPAWQGRLDVTVLIPVRDRVELLRRCLAATGGRYPVVVVDDASVDAVAVRTACDEHGAQLVRCEINGGPAVARNIGLAEIDTEFVLLVDSDCTAGPEVVAALARHMVDPRVAAVAPQIVAEGSGSLVGRYSQAMSSLDQGDRPARVCVGGRVSYVPTAALLVRRAAVAEVGGFDAALRFGEDVDLGWRLDAADWRVRYDPSVTVSHRDPVTWRELLTRRYRYGTSAGPLAQRHPGVMAPGVMHGWSLVSVLGVLARRPSLVMLGWGATVIGLRRTARDAQLASTATVAATQSVGETWLRGGRFAAQFLLPALLLRRVRRGRVAMVAALLIAAPLIVWRRKRPAIGVSPFVIAHIADDAAYGAGVIAGSIKARTAEPLTPIIANRMLRIDHGHARRASRTPESISDPEREASA